MTSAIQIEGELTQILFTSDEDGYTVARIRQKGQPQPTTIVGNLLSVNLGETLQLKGEWTNHKRYGRQFRVESYTILSPTTIDGIERYLSSRLIKGIGPIMAKRLTAHFGEKTLEIIETDPERLAEVDGFGPSRITQIRQAWETQQEIRQIILFLQDFGIGSSLAIKIYKHYGSQAIQTLKENPYRLASDIIGIGFKTADRIARAMGMEANAIARAQAGILFVLQEAAGNEGHLYLPYEMLLERSKRLLEIEEDEILHKAIADLFSAKEIILVDLNEAMESFQENRKAVYLPALYTSEKGVADVLNSFLANPSATSALTPEQALKKAEKELGLMLAEEQRQAIEKALTEKCLIITGGPGTGKTTLVKALVTIFRSLGYRSLLGAPTGRAAKRLKEVTGEPAKTIHRLLEFRFQQGGFQRNAKNPLDTRLLIIDETSMIDNVLFYHLMKALPKDGTLILIGDVNQLPSVGPGRILEDLIESGRIAVVRLSHIFRQARESLIITNAHLILSGKTPVSSKDKEELQDFYFIEEEDPERVASLILELYTDRIPRRFGFDPINDIQVISPMHRGTAGAENLNTLLQQAINPQGPQLQRGGWIYRQNDKIMQIRNNYNKEVFNGDIGRISAVDEEQHELTAVFDERSLQYEAIELDELIPAYAISVHKSQGNEYPALILPLLTQHYLLLQRNLVYTAITRGKKLVVIVGTRKAMGIAVRNIKTQKRYSLLKQRLQQ